MSDDFGGCLLFFFFFDCGVDAGTHWPLSFSILPDSQRHDLPSKILPPVQIWGGGQFPSELRGLPSGQAFVPPPGGGRQLGPMQSGSDSFTGWQTPSPIGRVSFGQHLPPLTASRGQQTPFASCTPSLQTHLPSRSTMSRPQSFGGLQVPSSLSRVPSGHPQ